MGELINIGSIMGKELLNLSDGTMLGKVCGVVLTPECKVAGLKVRERKLMGSTTTVAFENIKAFGATITLHGVSNVMAPETRSVLGKNVITADGNLLGRVEELAFDMETGTVEEIVIQGELMDTMLGGRGILPGNKIINFGKDVVIAAEQITAADFQQPEEGFYGDWKAMDEVLNEIDGETVTFDDVDAEADRASRVESTVDGLTKTLEETLQKLKDEVTSERFKEQTDRLIDRVGDETKNIFNELRLMVKNIDTEALKSKMSRKGTPEDGLAADLEEQLNGLTVEKPILDADGNVIAWPGQVMDKEKIKAALRAGVLQELLDYATVNLDSEAPAEAADEAEPAQPEAASVEEPEIEVEIIVDDILEVETAEDDAFIAEEAAKMEAAEQV